MIGNDIVDRAQARRESNWRRTGFLNKLFTTQEQQLIWAASDPDTLVWTLWSMKESVYKLVVRQTGQRFFAPQKLVCHLNTPLSGTVEGSVFYQRTYQTQSSVTDRYITSVAFFSNPVQPFTHLVVPFERTDYPYQYTAIRTNIKRYYATRFSIPESRIQIQKNEVGVPTLLICDSFGNKTTEVISLSHHGQYGAFALLI